MALRRERQRDRQTERQTDREYTARQGSKSHDMGVGVASKRQRQRERQRLRETEIETDRENNILPGGGRNPMIRG